jgi:hypothetical protein
MRLTQRSICSSHVPLPTVVEDFFEPVHADNQYGLCNTANGSYYISSESLHLEELVSGAEAKIDVSMAVTADANRQRLQATTSRTAASTLPGYVLTPAAVYTINSVIQAPMPQAAQLRAADVRSIVIIRMVYNDASPTYCDEACVADRMWGTLADSKCHYIYSGQVCGSVADNFLASSYGAMSWPQTSGRVISVNMGKNVPVGTCDVSTEMSLADSRALSLNNVDVTDYIHKEYFVPSVFGSCSWGGYATVGCARPGYSFSGGACWAMERDSFPTTRLHELGHNLGLYHAGLPPGMPAGEYGDESSPQGSARAWKGFNAPHRYQLGWLSSADVEKVGAEGGRYTLRSVHETPSGSTVKSAVYWDCPSCIANYYDIGTSGISELWVSFREPVGYDLDLPAAMHNKVFVHVRVLTSTGGERGTKLWKDPMAAGQSVTLTETGHTVYVCSIAVGEAVIFVSAVSATHALGLCTSHIAPPTPPSPPPSPPLPTCRCNSAQEPMSGSVQVSLTGCANHFSDSDPWCYVANPGCEGATASSAYPGAEWIDCTLSPPPLPLPPLPPPPPSPPPPRPSPPPPPTPPSPPRSPPSPPTTPDDGRGFTGGLMDSCM